MPSEEMSYWSSTTSLNLEDGRHIKDGKRQTETTKKTHKKQKQAQGSSDIISALGISSDLFYMKENEKTSFV